MTSIEAELFTIGLAAAVFGGFGLFYTRNNTRSAGSTFSLIGVIGGVMLVIGTLMTWSMRSQRNDRVATCSYTLKELGRDKRDTLIILRQNTCYDMKDSVLQILAADLGQTQ